MWLDKRVAASLPAKWCSDSPKFSPGAPRVDAAIPRLSELLWFDVHLTLFFFRSTAWAAFGRQWMTMNLESARGMCLFRSREDGELSPHWHFSPITWSFLTCWSNDVTRKRVRWCQWRFLSTPPNKSREWLLVSCAVFWLVITAVPSKADERSLEEVRWFHQSYRCVSAMPQTFDVKKNRPGRVNAKLRRRRQCLLRGSVSGGRVAKRSGARQLSTAEGSRPRIKEFDYDATARVSRARKWRMKLEVCTLITSRQLQRRPKKKN